MKRPWLCMAIFFALGEVLSYLLGNIWWIVLIIGLIPMVLFVKKRSILIICIAFLFGSLRMGADDLTYVNLKKLNQLSLENTKGAYEGRITDIDTKNDWTLLRIGELLVYCDPKDAKVLKIGNKIRISAQINEMDKPRNEGAFNYKLYYRSIGITHRCFADNITILDNKVNFLSQGIYDLRKNLLLRISNIYDEIDSGVLRAALLGDKSMMNEDLYDLYRKNGIAHLLAISGLHVGILGMGLYELLRKKIHLSFITSGVIASVFIIFYCILTGFGVSTLRATIMLVLTFIAGMFGRKSDMLSSIGLSSLIILLIHPYELFNCGFLLSFACVIAIAGPFKYLSKELNVENPILSSLLLSLTVSLFTLPITSYFFFEISLFGFLLNLIVIPLMTFVVWSGLISILLTFIYIPLSKIAAGSAHYILSLYSYLCTIVSKLPFSSILIGRPKLWQIFVFYLLFFLVLYSSPVNLKRLKYRLSMSDKETEFT